MKDVYRTPFFPAVERITREFLTGKLNGGEDTLTDLLTDSTIHGSRDGLFVKVHGNAYELNKEDKSTVWISIDGGSIGHFDITAVDTIVNVFTKLTYNAHSMETLTSLGGTYKVIRPYLCKGYNFIKHNSPSWKTPHYISKLIELEDIWLDELKLSTSSMMRLNKRQMKKAIAAKRN